MKTFYSQLAPIASPQCTICSAIETVPGSWTNLSASTTAPLLARLTAALGRQWAADLCSATLCLSCLRQLQGVEQLRGRHQRLEASLARVCRKASDSLDASATSCIACHSLLSVHDTANAFWDKAQFSSTLLANILAKFMTKPPEPGSSAGSRVCGRCVARLNQLDLLAVRADRRARAMGGRLRAGAAAAGARRPNGPPDSQAVPEDPAGHLTPLDEMLLQLTADHEEEAGLPSPSLPLLTTGGPSADRSSDLLNISGRPDTGGGLEKAGRGDGLRGEGLEEYGRNDGGLEAPVDDGVGELLGDVQAVEGGPQKANSDRQNNKDSRDFRPTSKVVQPVSSAAAAASQPPDRPVRTIYVQLVAGDATGAAGPAEVNEVRAAPATAPAPAPAPAVTATKGRRPAKIKVQETVQLQYMTARAALPNQVSDPIGPPSGPDRPVGPGTAASGDTAVKSEREEGGEQWLEAQDRVAERDSQVVGTVSSATLGWLGPPAEPSHVTHRRRLAEAMERVNSRIAEKRLKSSRFAATKEDREDENVEPREDGEDIEEEFEDGEDTVKAEQSETSEEWTVSVRSRRVNGLYVCEVCHDSFAMLRELLKHERTHTEAKFPCPMCNRSFTLPKLVRRHQKFHKVPRAYQCGECGLRCRSQLVLLDHMHTHTGGEHISCGQCGQTFASRVRYRSHLRAHKGRPGPPHCAECRLKFANKAALQRHQREQHSEPQLVACPEPDCERRFDSQKRLTHHLLQHLAGPPWRCKAL
ncbi:Oocyte zinc finger protein XlCOF26 [Amphibalanus amphitrite]|uniref:Oocyte zinc finger protein XlCOF26 n=1 Tax=Amphibalanus amphitrite TaxID=1232801 RepID=A0A6A4VP53_AMPAM|nr:Oocyte zinc finger protein XlCOF26 [Amphibalanus amphitrite]KAF0293324.1 Oocyte zinc finger protein XlCOF26 [Amphibalanus amphitrite]